MPSLFFIGRYLSGSYEKKESRCAREVLFIFGEKVPREAQMRATITWLSLLLGLIGGQNVDLCRTTYSVVNKNLTRELPGYKPTTKTPL